MGGTPVFTGTRLPIHSLLDFVGSGQTSVDSLSGLPIANRKRADNLAKKFEREMKKKSISFEDLLNDLR